MKKQTVAILALLLLAAVAMAEEWVDVFHDTYQAKGIDEAVVNALGESITPDQIVKTGLPIEGLNPAELIKALFCALVPPAYIYDAAAANQVKDETVVEGYELALAQCAEAMEEKENAPPLVLPGKPPAGLGPVRPGAASPSNFEQ